jgi:hypothetical protein
LHSFAASGQRGRENALRRVSDESRITLLLRGSSSLCESDRTAKGSPIERIYESYGKAENIVGSRGPCPSRLLTFPTAARPGW